MTEREYAEQRSIGELLRDLANNTQTLVSKEIQLAKLELRETAQGAGLGLGLLATAAALGLVGLMMLALTAAYALMLILPDWVAALIVASIFLVLSAVLALAGRSRLAHLKPRPDQTIETLKEDQEWLKRQLS